MTNLSCQDLEKRLGYSFRKKEKLAAALTHSSTGADANYERLEFLGDRVLGLVMAEVLYQKFPLESEGDMAKRHAALVQGTTLAEAAREIDLGNFMQFSDAERAAGGAENDNILADSLEAVLGALYLDAGLEKTRQVIEALWGDRVLIMSEPPQDPKTALQEWAQARGLPLPIYHIQDREGPDHAPVFTIQVAVEGFDPVSAHGASRRAGEKEAARKLLEILEQSA